MNVCVLTNHEQDRSDQIKAFDAQIQVRCHQPAESELLIAHRPFKAGDPQKTLSEVRILLQLLDGAVKGDENGNLGQGRQDRCQRAELVFDVKTRRFFRHFFFIVRIALTNRLDLRLQLHCAGGGFHLAKVEWVEKGLCDESEDYDREAEIICTKSIQQSSINQLDDEFVNVDDLLKNVEAGLCKNSTIIGKVRRQKA